MPTSNNTYSVVADGYNPSSGAVGGIQYVTTDTLSNTSSFGSLSFSRMEGAGTSNGTYGVFVGGRNSSSYGSENAIDYIAFDTPGNATDLGDLTVDRFSIGATAG